MGKYKFILYKKKKILYWFSKWKLRITIFLSSFLCVVYCFRLWMRFFFSLLLYTLHTQQQYKKKIDICDMWCSLSIEIKNSLLNAVCCVLCGGVRNKYVLSHISSSVVVHFYWWTGDWCVFATWQSINIHKNIKEKNKRTRRERCDERWRRRRWKKKWRARTFPSFILHSSTEKKKHQQRRKEKEKSSSPHLNIESSVRVRRKKKQKIFWRVLSTFTSLARSQFFSSEIVAKT